MRRVHIGVIQDIDDKCVFRSYATVVIIFRIIRADLVVARDADPLSDPLKRQALIEGSDEIAHVD